MAMNLRQEDEWREKYPLSVPAVREIYHQVVARLEALGWPDLTPFFSQLLGRFARWTLDLPASESYHHPFPFGLLVHSAEAVDSALAIGGDCIRCLPPPWRKILIALALYHDCGRLFDLTVRDPNSDGRWNPLRQSLFEFREDRTLPLTGGGHVQLRRGRGIGGHEERGYDLLPILLPREHAAEVERDLDHTFFHYVRRSCWPSENIDPYSHIVTGVVTAADHFSVIDDRFRRRTGDRNGAPQGFVHAPVRYNSLKTGEDR